MGRFEFKSFDAVVKLTDIFQQWVIFFEIAEGLGWGAKHHRVRRHAFGEPRHGTNDDFVADFDVSTETDLASEGDIVAHACAARDTDLCTEDAMPTDGHVVADLNQVVDFRPFLNPSASEAGSIDRGIGADLDIAVNLDSAGLGDFLCRPSLSS